ncbi:hypothetical protein MGYG_08738 [Nannizzia gypsea CBS 118893]|uniref:Uncharacterized protein n=1 Tax=Arthroderma gypseum (strain ATCC MYA-4604 / CBS 118893) TaxID=535722 RepID=E4V6U9_ARTGP|nr:hypothetical protein MGYG_08738 [Nannizzia gypsea CBS 118893]EFQ96815.1 hypothetical protein MGYG_08738 [Nannizzia gypsea CBS 118893]
MESLLRLNPASHPEFRHGMVLFCAPGIYVGRHRPGSRRASRALRRSLSLSNVILYGLFTLCGWVRRHAAQHPQTQKSVMIGSIGYPLYVAGLWYYDRTGHSWFPLLASTSWAPFISNPVDAAVDWPRLWAPSSPLLPTSPSKKPVGVSSAVYGDVYGHPLSARFSLAFFLPWSIAERSSARMGTPLSPSSNPPSCLLSSKAMARAFFDPRMFILFPAILGCEMGLALVSSINAFYFNLRTRSINNLAFHSIQVFMPWIMVCILDNRQVKNRKTRGFIGVAVIGAVSVGASAGLYAWLDINNIASLKKPQAKDWTDPEFGGMFALFLLFGAIYAAYQMTIEWVVSALTNDPSKLAQFGGVFKGTLSLGICLSFVMAAQNVPFVGQLSLQFSLYVIGVIGMVYVLIVYVKETNYFTEENVIAPLSVEEQARVAGLVTEEQIQSEATKNKVAGMNAQVRKQDVEVVENA